MAMAEELILNIVTPDKLAFSGKVDYLTIPGAEGEFGVFMGHAALLSGVNAGELSYTTEDGSKTYFAVDTGFVEVLPGKVTVLVEAAERADAIDREEVTQAREEALELLSQLSRESVTGDALRAEIARMEVWLKVSEKV